VTADVRLAPVARRRLPMSLLAGVPPIAAGVWLTRRWPAVEAGTDALGHAHPGWLAVALAAALLTWVAGAACQQGAVAGRLPAGPLLAVQVAGSVANHLLPAGVGVGAVKARFLHRRGLAMAEVLAAIGLDATAGALTHLAVLVILLAAGLAPLGLRPHAGWGPPPALVWAVVVAAVAVLVVPLLPAVRRAGRRAWVQACAQVRAQYAVVRAPRRAALLWGGSAAIPALHAATLWAVVCALHLPLSAGAVFTIYFAASAVSALVPSPGGFGSLDAALTAAIVAAGEPTTAAVAAVLGYRTITVWLPLGPSVCVLAALVRRGHL
jgi:glycosyltransferase 2 family protein